MDRRTRYFLLSMTVAALACRVESGFAQPVAPNANSATAAEYSEPVFSPPDRKMLQKLNNAQKLLEQERYSQAVRALVEILDPPKRIETADDGDRTDDDYFFKSDPELHPGDGRRFSSLKSEARRILGQLPPPARQAYELGFGGLAKRKLQRAIESGDIEAVAEVTRKYFHTQAGYDAMVLLGRYHMDRGRPLAAALCFRQVYETQAGTKYEPALSLLTAACWQRAGDANKAKEVLLALKQRYPNSALQIGGKPIDLFRRSDDALNWLARVVGQTMSSGPWRPIDWVMFRGNPARSGVSRGGQPLLSRPLWQQRVAADLDVEASLSEQRQLYVDRGVVAVPSMQPLAVGNLVLVRTPQRISAVDFATGKLVWQIEPYSELATATDSPQSAVKKLNQLIWLDKTYGTMSCDGERMFVVEGFGGSGREILDRFGRRQYDSSSAYNILAAYDVSRTEGKLAWSVGGPEDGDEKLSQAFFLGPPLPLQGRLYVIAELSGEIRLVVLDARTGGYLWDQPLAVIQAGDFDYLRRRTCGISPSFAEGVLVCPTGVGAVVAIELTTRSLLWGHQYPSEENGRVANRGWGGRRSASAPEPENLWADSCAVISNGRLIITPAESKEIHCVKLENGEMQWHLPRAGQSDEYSYLACVHDGMAIVVGRSELTAIDMENGKVAKGWPLKLPAGSVPSGRGFHAERYYYLPLNSAGGGEVAKIDLGQPSIVNRAKSHNDTIPGNLIAFRGQIISQGTDWLQAFYQRDVLEQEIDRRLKNDPADPWALMRQGEMLVDVNKHAEAAPLFRRSREMFAKVMADNEAQQNDAWLDAYANHIEARELLLSALLRNLDGQFVGHRDSVAEIERLIERPRERIDYLRILAKGLEDCGELRESLRAYFQLADASATTKPMMKISNTHTVRLDRWLRARLSRLQTDLNDQQREVFVNEVATRRDGAIRDGSLVSLRTFLDYFAWHESADNIREQLVAKLDATSLLGRCQVLRELAASDDPAQQRAAVAQMAALHLKARHFREAAHYYQQLRDQWPDEVVWQGKTGSQLFEALPAESPARQPKVVQWPYGKVELAAGNAGRPNRSVSYQPGFKLNLLGRRNPTREYSSIVVDQQQRYTVYGMDGYGNPEWTVALGGDRRSLMMNRGLSCGRMDGPLLILSVGYQVMAIDTLAAKSSDSGKSAVLWTQAVKQYVPGVPSRRGGYSSTPSSSTDPPPWGDDSPQQYRAASQQLVRLGPITPGGVTFLRNRDLVSVDPVSGETLWTRRGVYGDVDLFGDDEHVFLAPRGKKEAVVVNAVDGSEIARVELPPEKSRWRTLGRRMLIWRTPKDQAGTRDLAMFDPLTGKDDWVHGIARGAKGALIRDQAVAILQRNGRFFIFDLATGEKKVDRMLDKELGLKGIYMIPSQDQYILVTTRGASRVANKRQIYPMPQQHGSALVTGRIYAFDSRTGELQWPTVGPEQTPVSAQVKQYGLVLNQAPELPVLVFARREVQNNKYSTSFLIIDKRTGRLAVPPKLISRVYDNFDLSSDYGSKTLTVYFQNRSSNFSLKFTDEPLPPSPPIQVEGERLARSKQINSVGDALRAFRKAGENRAVQEGNDDDLFGEDE
ncbi:MAG: PQQ-binding-like beta-propeller repeat protein [Pirellulales bacterium]